ncbi:MAG: signal peptide peptidase SppA [Planctomycetaceae bacterium]|nr:signal peptide peptidase SppA [Planctomycetaceae bacterium]
MVAKVKFNLPRILGYAVLGLFLVSGIVANMTSTLAQEKAAEPAKQEPAAEVKPAQESGEKKAEEAKPAETKSSEAKPADAAPEKKGEESKAAEKKDNAEKKETPPPPKNQVQVITLSGTYVDLMGATAFDPTSLLTGAGPGKRKSFYKLCDYLDELGRSEKVTHVVFDLSDSSIDFNLAQLDELTRRLHQLKKSGKKMSAWLENASSTHLAIAASCDFVALADFGGIDMPSMSMQSIFYRDAMDLVGVKASVVRAGNFKGAVEPYVNSVMSEHLRDHYLEMLKSMNEAQVSIVAKGRGLTTEKVRELQAKRVILPSEAMKAGLVDKLAPYGSMKETMNGWIKEPAGWIETTAKPKKEMSVFELMGKLMSGPDETSSRTKDNTIAVMHLSGAIEDGKKASPGSIVSGPTVKAIEEIIKDDKIKAVVVRINSPGGSATASEAIRRALVQLKNKKPTIISMGDMAASGGYWVSCIGVPVYAERGTLTGSIGVFSMKLSFGSLIKRIGLHFENISLDESANAFSPDRTWTEEDEKALQGTIDEVYTKFLALVSDSRGIKVEKLEDLAGGRVWSGTQAKRVGLVDEIGGLDDCLAVVAKKAGLEKYNVIHRPNVSGGLDLSSILGEADDEEVRLMGISSDALKLLRQRGVSSSVLDCLLRDAMQNVSGRPTIWAIGPAEIHVK